MLGPGPATFDNSIRAQYAATSFEQAAALLMPDRLAYFVRRVIPGGGCVDCLSETMLVLWRKRQQLPNVESERRAWAFGEAKRVLSNHERGRIHRTARADRVRDEVRESVPPVEVEADSAELNASLVQIADDCGEFVHDRPSRLVLYTRQDVAGALIVEAVVGGSR